MGSESPGTSSVGVGTRSASTAPLDRGAEIPGTRDEADGRHGDGVPSATPRRARIRKLRQRTTSVRKICGGYWPPCRIVFSSHGAALQSGRCWFRTNDLCRVKAVCCILPCPTVSENYAVLQVFYENSGGGVSTAYAPVSARLQYGCSNFPVSKSVSWRRTLTRFLRVFWRHCRSRYSRAAARNSLPSLIVCSASSSLTVSGAAE